MIFTSLFTSIAGKMEKERLTASLCFCIAWWFYKIE